MASIREQINESTGATITSTQLRGFVIAAIEHAVEQPIGPDDLGRTPAEFGLDSFGLMMVLSEVEESIGVDIPDAALDRFDELRDVRSISSLLEFLTA